MRTVLVCAAVACLALTACQKQGSRLNAPPHGSAEEVAGIRSSFDHMTDNALIADMTVSDVHFHPHRSMLNTLGEERVRRLAGILEVYGGTVRFTTDSRDDEFAQKRLDAVVALLADHGIDTTQEVVTRDMPGDAGMDAAQAILIRKHEATYDPAKKSQKQNQQTGFILK